MAELKLFGKTIPEILKEERDSETPAAKAEQLDRIKRNMDIAGATLAGKPKATPGNIGSRVDFSDEKTGPSFKSPKKITREKTTVEGDLGSVDTSNPDVIGPNMGQANPMSAAPVAPELSPQQQAANLLSRPTGYKRGGQVKSKHHTKAPSRTHASKRGDGIATKGHTKGKYL